MYKDQARLAAAHQIEQEQAYNAHVATMARQERELTQISDAVMNQKIDPNRLWHESSTGGKIAASIGLILGGIGAGLAGGPNQALAMVNKMVDRDIDAQKSELGKKQTLYSMNMQKLHNENAAYMATKLQLASVYQGQLAQSTAMAQSQIAKQNGAVAQAEIQRAMLPMKQELAKYHMSQQLLYGQGGAGSNEARLSQAENIVFNKEDRERLVHVDDGKGGIRPLLANSVKDADKVKEAEAEYGQIQKDINRARAFMKNTGTTVWGSNKDAVAKGIEKSMLGSMNKLMQINRFTEAEMKEIFEPLVPNPGAVRQGRAEEMLNLLDEKIRDNRDAMFRQYTVGHNPGKFKSKEGAPVR
jgi:hypothetical protein